MAVKEILLIFDLDETLIHASTTRLNRDADFHVGDFYIYKRPNVDCFLDKYFNKYQIAIWSSADDDYVKETIQRLIPNNSRLEFIWTRLNCSVKVVKKPLLEGFEGGGYYKEYQKIKPLRKVRQKGIGIKAMLIIDNSPYKVAENRDNALVIPSFEGDESDDELFKLFEFLERFEDVKDVRKLEKGEWGIS